MIINLGEIDTLNEKYQAQASIEARWPVELDKLSAELSADDKERLLDGKSITLSKYAESHWHPQLYIENALGDLKEQIRYTAKKSNDDSQTYICEHRDIKGLFWEKLELHHFPSDVQDLSISIASMLYDDKVILTVDPYRLSGVNRESFVDQQEWLLYRHVDTEHRFVKEFLLSGDDDDTRGIKKDEQKRSILTVTCHAGLYLRRKKSNHISLFLYSNSSSLKLFLLERILSYFRNYSCIFLYFCNSTKVSSNPLCPTD